MRFLELLFDKRRLVQAAKAFHLLVSQTAVISQVKLIVGFLSAFTRLILP
jgi:hypothetical protein